jgi:aryl-alcohol dehydrogenase-like predicted oxidoreductase
MKRVSLNYTDLQISTACLSVHASGPTPDPRDTWALLDAFRARGGNFIQTASQVSSIGPAASENAVGGWLRERRIRRDEVVLAARVVVRPEIATDRIAVTQYLAMCVEASRRRLQVEHLDLLICAWSVDGLPVEAIGDAWRVLHEHRRVRVFGLEGLPVETLARARRNMEVRGVPPIQVVQETAPISPDAPDNGALGAWCRATGTAWLAAPFVAASAPRETSAIVLLGARSVDELHAALGAAERSGTAALPDPVIAAIATRYDPRVENPAADELLVAIQ